jgi:hypothetical protein
MTFLHFFEAHNNWEIRNNTNIETTTQYNDAPNCGHKPFLDLKTDDDNAEYSFFTINEIMNGKEVWNSQL